MFSFRKFGFLIAALAVSFTNTSFANAESRVENFSLIDAHHERVISGYERITGNTTIDLNELATDRLNVRANLSPRETGSVRFYINGGEHRTENVFPYSLNGDVEGDYYVWRPGEGSYTIRAVPFSGSHAKGQRGDDKSIRLTFKRGSKDDTPGNDSADLDIISFTLIDAERNREIDRYDPIPNGARINLKDLPEINIRANTQGRTVGSVRFSLNGDDVRTENVYPYAMAGDTDADYYEWTDAKPGTYRLRAQAFADSDAAGKSGSAKEITFHLSDNDRDDNDPPEPPPGDDGHRVISLSLMNADTDQAISGHFTLNNGAELNLDNLPANLSLRANTEPDEVGSVKFEVNGQTVQVENFAPYALAGDDTGNFATWNLTPGEYTVKATAFAQSDANGGAGGSKTVRFNVVRGGGDDDDGDDGGDDDDNNPDPDPEEDNVNPTVRITQPTPNASYSTQNDSINLGGNASDNEGLRSIKWSNARGGNGTANGTEGWSVNGISLQEGENRITVTAEDTSGNRANDTLSVIYNKPDSCSSSGGDGAFIEQNGKVIVEFESEPKAGDWDHETSLDGYKGSGYYIWNGPNHYGNPGNGTLTYQVKINDAGSYKFRIRTRAHDGGRNDEHNDVWARINNGPWAKYYDQSRNWTWDAKCDTKAQCDPTHVFMSFDLNAGIHTVQFSGRSDLFAMDRFALFKNDMSDSQLTNSPESPRQGGDAGNCPPDGDTTPPTVTIESPTQAESYMTSERTVNLSGRAADNRGLNAVKWRNSRGGNGTANGKTTWSINAIELDNGDNVITVTAEDTSGLTTSDTLTVEYVPDDDSQYDRPDSEYTPNEGWKDSYAVGGRCYCDSNFDHGIANISLDAYGGKTVRQVCQAIDNRFGEGPDNGRELYNTVQCGHRPYNGEGDEEECPGLVTRGVCNVKTGPTWPSCNELFDTSVCGGGSNVDIEGEMRQWHKVELHFDGPEHHESDDNDNPFLDYRLQCLFTGPSGQEYDVPGFFNTDRNGGERGNQWTCRFAPDQTGQWGYRASFRKGNNVAVSTDSNAGSPTSFDGTTGSFSIAGSNKSGRDFRSSDKGRILNRGHHYLTFASGKVWIKGGPDIPENLLGYNGFDNTPKAGHDFDQHRRDWNSGDPNWTNDRGKDGKGIIGALNYIASTGSNCVYFLPMNIGGDAKDTYPYRGEYDKTHFDTSKLEQWETVFTHADRKGIFLHFQLAETEGANENYHDNGNLGTERKLYYRELIARFGHHLGLEWDIGEENDYGTSKRKQFAAHLKRLDPYDNPVTTHTHGGQFEQFYGPLLGDKNFDITGFQGNINGLNRGRDIPEWRRRSANAGAPLVISLDEPQTIHNDPNDNNLGYPNGRRNFLWPVYMSGGGGFEWYVQQDGGGHSFDQQIDNFRDMDVALEWTGHALDFLDTLPLLQMEPSFDIGRADNDGGNNWVYGLFDEGQVYALYQKAAGNIEVDLRGVTGSFSVRWFNPRSGQWINASDINGGGWRSIGNPPFGDDAAVVIRKK